jgi:hypothetical protein
MKKSEVDDALYEGISQFLVPAGFTAINPECGFKRPTSFGFQEVIYDVRGYAPKFIFSFSVAIRFDAIQDVVGPFSGISPECRDEAFTIHVSPEYFERKELNIEICSPEEVSAALRIAESFFQEIVFPFFDKCSSLEAAEYLLNHDPNYNFTGNYVYKAVCGVAAAAVCRRSDFLEIVERYRQELGGYIEPLRNRFEAAVTYLTTNFLAK